MNYLYLAKNLIGASWPHPQLLSFRRLSAACVMALAVAFGSTLIVSSDFLQAQDKGVSAVATVNINTADATALAARLKGVGHAKALEIIRYREAYGPFASVDELAEVKGIGRSTLDKNRSVITLE